MRETGVCYPDIELLPSIANYFDISLDELVGMNDIRSEARRREIFTAALNFEREKNWESAIRILRDALKTYPRDEDLHAELALALSGTGDDQNLSEAIAISEDMLERCTNEKLRSTLRANLCHLYRAVGQSEKALALGKTLPHIWECREILLPDLVAEDDRAKAVLRALNIAAQVLGDVAAGRQIPFSLGYRPEACLNVSALRDCLNQITSAHPSVFQL